MKPRADLFLVHCLIITLAIAFCTLLFLAQMRSDALELAKTEQEEAIRSFWHLLRDKGTDFRIVGGKLMADDYVINGNWELPDRITEIFGGTATVFMGDTRVSTNVLTADGIRAIGTKLTGPARNAIFRENRPYRGEARILGIPHFTAYDPIRDRNGRVIGVLNVGMKKSEFLEPYSQMRLNMIVGIAAIELLFLAISFALLRERIRYGKLLLKSEQTLQEQLGFLQTLIDAIPSPIFYKDRGGRYLGNNKAFESSLGLTKEELVGKTVYDIAPRDLADKYFEMDEALLTNPGVQVYESSVVYADGTRHDVVFNKATFTANDGSVGGLVGVLHDITERKRAEDALTAAENKFRSLVEQSLTGIYIIQDGKFAYVNPKMAEIFGYTRDELMAGITHLALTADKDRALAAENVRRRVAGEVKSLHYGFQGVRRDGETIDIEAYGTCIEYNGRPAIIGTLLDVTGRKHAEDALRESEERFYQIFVQNWDAVILFRLDTFAIIDANPAALQLFALPRAEMLGLTPGSLVESDDFRKLIDMIPLDDHSSSFQLDRAEAFRKDGTRMTVSIRAKVLRLREEYVVYCSYRDITERVRMEEEILNTQARLIHTNKMTSLGMLASSIAHEINNPNNYISINAAMLADVWRDAAPVLRRHSAENGDFPLGGLPFSEMSELAPRLFTAITEGSRRINTIVSNMKDYVKADSGSLFVEFDVNRMVEDAAAILWHHVHKYTDAFMLSLADNLPPARGNRQQIEQVVINLITNALQALPGRDAFVCVTTSLDRPAGHVLVTIRDEGRGMGEEVLQRLTDPFFTTRSEEGGTGLGLYIAASIIREHKGSLEFDSAVGRGTTVTVRLLAAEVTPLS